ncbi:ABC transporter ATP-binding protein [uncultured Fibrella sp.]|uniref:ABC transporter ATP-binding protein n=1 Tax=uncultured Fibrella sp. TaxID=1284596 RepID=UPI0035CB2813
MSTITVDSISHSFGNTKALTDVSFSVRSGELFGLIGPDGAGKTTLFKILVTLLLPNSGHATVIDLDVVRDFQALRHRIGYMAGRFSLYPDLTVEENLTFFATVFGTDVQTNYELVKDIYDQLAPFKDRRAGKLSGGMKQKLALCCALIHKPDVLFLDEPTTGVDAVSRREFWEMLRQLRNRGLTVLVSTPYMDEADRCDRVAFIQAGRILAVDTPTGITTRFKKPLFAIRGQATYRLIQDLRQADFTDACYAFGDSLHLTAKPGTEAASVATYLHQQGHDNADVQPITAGIEDTFMELMKHG